LRAIRCRQRRYFELRVILEQLDEALADNAGGAENAYAKVSSHKRFD
jgi:hypothetical protein